jgi:crossover junction endodeoxyribonuclease RuvC
MTSILALDLAAKTGFAWGHVNHGLGPDHYPLSGSAVFGKPGASMAAIFRNCRLWLKAFISEHQVDVVIFEAPLVPMFKAGATNINTIRILMGLPAIVEEALYGLCDVREARVAEVRRHFLGSTKFKRTAAKALTIAACRRLGWKPVDDNAADALALWHYQASIFEPKLSIQTSPLFRRTV